MLNCIPCSRGESSTICWNSAFPAVVPSAKTHAKDRRPSANPAWRTWSNSPARRPATTAEHRSHCPTHPAPVAKGRGIAYFDRIIRLGIYEEPIRTLILQLKYHNKWTIGEHLADWLLQQERVKGLLTQTQCLAPVPLHRWRQVTRGYNQAEILARRLSKKCRIPMVHPAAAGNEHRNPDTSA